MANLLYAGAPDVALQGAPKCCQLAVVSDTVIKPIWTVGKSNYNLYLAAWASEL